MFDLALSRWGRCVLPPFHLRVYDSYTAQLQSWLPSQPAAKCNLITCFLGVGTTLQEGDPEVSGGTSPTSQSRTRKEQGNGSAQTIEWPMFQKFSLRYWFWEYLPSLSTKETWIFLFFFLLALKPTKKIYLTTPKYEKHIWSWFSMYS